MEEREFLTSPGRFRDFLEGSIWTDIKHELNSMRELARDGMEGADDDDERRACSYRARTIREMIIMIEGFGETVGEETKEINDDEEEEPSNEIDYTLGGENG